MTTVDRTEQQVSQVVASAVSNVPAEVAIRLSAAQTNSTAYVTQIGADFDAAAADAQQRLVQQWQSNVTAAEQKYSTDQGAAASTFGYVNPPPPQSSLQIAADYLPQPQTILLFGALAAAAVAAPVLLPLAPVAGVVMGAVSGGVLAYQLSSSASTRYFDNGQTGVQAVLGATADLSGVGGLYAGLTNKDIASGGHLNLTEAQQRQMITEGGIQTALTAFGGVQAGRSFLRGRAAAARTPNATEAPATPPARPTTGSNAGGAGAVPEAAPRPQPMVGRRAQPGIGENGPVWNGNEAELANSPLQPVRNTSATINGRDFSAHALDQMQNRGMVPSVVENTIQYGIPFPGNRAGTQGFFDSVNQVRVIINSNNGTVITVIPGGG